MCPCLHENAGKSEPTHDISVKPGLSDGASSTVLAISNKCICGIHIVSLPFTLTLIIVGYNGPKTLNLYIYKRPFTQYLSLELLERSGSLCQYEVAQVTNDINFFLQSIFLIPKTTVYLLRLLHFFVAPQPFALVGIKGP